MIIFLLEFSLIFQGFIRFQSFCENCLLLLRKPFGSLILRQQISRYLIVSTLFNSFYFFLSFFICIFLLLVAQIINLGWKSRGFYIMVLMVFSSECFKSIPKSLQEFFQAREKELSSCYIILSYARIRVELSFYVYPKELECQEYPTNLGHGYIFF